MFFLVLWASSFNLLHRSAVKVCTSIFRKKSHEVMFFSSSTTLNEVKHSVFVHISSVFEARLKPIAASVT